jgi:hypothetical protein
VPVSVCLSVCVSTCQCIPVSVGCEHSATPASGSCAVWRVSLALQVTTKEQGSAQEEDRLFWAACAD